jgi:hypothetical protein
MFHTLYKEVIEHFIQELSRKENQDKLKAQIIDPLIYHMVHKMYPYIFITTSVFLLLLVLLFSILYLLMKRHP